MNTVTKTRILFVDDEPSILELLELTVGTMPGSWETRIAESGEQALNFLEREAFDVVVSDMRMPGMNGAQLLNEVMRRYPATSRIILSGFADQQELLRCVGATHQFLAKPCELAALQALLGRIRGLRERFRSDDIQRLITHRASIPCVPAVYFRIAEAMQEPDCPMERISEAVATDPGLTARILQLANSAFFGYAREVSSAHEAVMLLGVGRLRSLALTAHLFTPLDPAISEHWSIDQVWGHSVLTAQWAGKLARMEGETEESAEQAFTAGILHDVGKLLLLNNLLEDYVDILAIAEKENRPLVDVEHERLGSTHADVGAYLLDLWGLPMPLVEAVALHHEPGRTGELAFSPLTAVHVANLLEQAAHSPNGQDSLNHLDGLYLDQLGLSSRVAAWRESLEQETD